MHLSKTNVGLSLALACLLASGSSVAADPVARVRVAFDRNGVTDTRAEGMADVAAGAAVARHTHPGVESTFVVEGDFELSVQGQPAKRVRAGEGVRVPPEAPHGLQNGAKPTKLAITYVVEKGKPLASPA